MTCAVVDDGVIIRDALITLMHDNQLDAVPMASIAEFHDIPIVMLTRRGDETDKIVGLDRRLV